MTGHKIVPKLRSLDAPPGRQWWRCNTCGRSWPFIPADNDRCEGADNDTRI